MRAFLLFFVLALFAMASAQRGKGNNPEQVHFVDNANPGQVHFVNNDPNNPSGVNFVNNDPNNPSGVNFVNNDPNNPSGVHFVNNNNNPSGVNFVNNNPNDPTAVHIVDGNSDQVVITNPDPYFGQPSYPQRPEQPDISPAWVQRPYPGKQYDNPYARGGK